jgi:hypothetical protein
MKRLCLLGFVIAALFCSGSANGQDLEALLSKFKAETDLARKERLLNEILQESGKATFADKLDSWLISSMLPPKLK